MKGKLALSIELRPQATAILKIEGSVDPETVRQLEAAFKQLDKDGARHIVVDLTQMTYISSAGLALLVNAKVDRVQKHGDVILVKPQPAVQNVLNILLANVFRVSPSVDEALAQR